MRIYSNDDRRFLSAARHVSKHVAVVKLSSVQEALSRAMGYRDFYDFRLEHKGHQASPLDQEISEIDFRKRWVKIIVDVSILLDSDDGTIQYYLSQTRLLGDRKWTLDDHLAIRAQCWHAQGIVGPFGRTFGGFGRIIEQDTQLGDDGYIVNVGRPSTILGRSGFWNCADYELVPLQNSIDPFVPYSHYIPYGYKTEIDRKIYFGREYFPLWIVNGDGKVDRPNPWEEFHVGADAVWFNTITGEHFLSSQTRQLALQSLTDDGVSGLPVFANATPTILKSGATSLSVTVDELKKHYQYRQSWKPTLAKYANRGKSYGIRGKESVIVDGNDWDRLLKDCNLENGTSSDPCGYFEFGGLHFLREASVN